jgi:hypothetical protein
VPLPMPNSPWPMEPMGKVHADIDIWSAWWSGSTERLMQVYGGGQTSTEQGFTARGGLVGAAKRLFWGTQPPSGQQNAKLHVPLAAQIAQVSANLLFSEPPKITVEDAATQERLDALIGETAHRQLHAAAESCAALGHVYLRVGWDLDVDPTAPLLSVVDADCAYPVYSYGRLREVTFCREFKDGATILRHLEHHEPGMIWHGLYAGDTKSLGRMVPLTDHPQTASLADSVSVEGGGIPTGLDMLTVVAVANAPTRTWRHIPGARDLGRPDISGVEDVLDKLDEAWSSLMRDIRLGKARVYVPQHMLESHGAGKGASVNLDQEIHIGLSAPPDGPLQFEAQQFDIRWQEHDGPIQALRMEAVSGAGYSPQTFGMGETAALTAAESDNRRQMTHDTTNGKVRYWRPATADLAQLLVAVDRVHFGGAGSPDLRPDVDFGDSAVESLLSRAQAVQAAHVAEAASTQERVRMLHRDWDDGQVQDEVKRITAERGLAADPLTMFDQLEPGPGRQP